MGLLQILTQKEEKKSLGVCIPEHRAKMLEDQTLILETKKESKAPHITAGTPIKNANKAKNAAQDLLLTKEGSFQITGAYRVLDTIMLSGIVEEGTIRKRMVSHHNGKEIKISEIRHGNEEIEQLIGGQEGTIFVTARIPPLINAGEILDFKG